jgi:23S rRNA (guanine745-N1)-methyltransferase
MVAARNRVHQAGLFALVAESLRDLTHSNPAQAGGTVMEVGAGPAYYLASLVESTQATGLALDISTAAARAAAQASRRIAAVVADVWQPLPLLDGVIDLILCVFAPRNLPEFARVLHPAGQVVVVTPNSGHLARLRQQYGLIGIGQAKTTDLQRGPFRLIAAQQLCYPVELPAPLATDVIGMGPNAFHHPPPVTEGLTDHVDLTIHMLDLPEGTS